MPTPADAAATPPPSRRRSRFVANSDDAEQDGTNVRIGGNDLHIGPNIVGLRFVNVGIPKDVTIVSATVQFTASADDADPTTVVIVGLNDPNSPTFSNTANDISTGPAPCLRCRGRWIRGSTKQAGAAERTPDLSALLAELVAQQGSNGSSPVVLRFEAGTGQRRAVEFSGDPAHASLLQVTFTAPLSVDVPVRSGAVA